MGISAVISAAALLVSVRAGAVRLDGYHGGAQVVVQGVAETFVGEFVAGQVVRQPGAGDLRGVGEIGWMGRGLAQGEQDPAADRVGEGAAEPRQHLDVSSESQHRRAPAVSRSANTLITPAQHRYAAGHMLVAARLVH